MELLIVVSYVVLGAAIGFGVRLMLALRHRAISGDPPVEPFFSALASVTVYLFSTSVWAYRAVGERVPGTTPTNLTPRLYYVIWDHTILCAVVGSGAAAAFARIAFDLFPKRGSRP